MVAEQSNPTGEPQALRPPEQNQSNFGPTQDRRRVRVKRPSEETGTSQETTGQETSRQNNGPPNITPDMMS